MKRVVGIGGIFFKANDPESLGAWYKEHLGLDVNEWGATFSTKKLLPECRGGLHRLVPNRSRHELLRAEASRSVLTFEWMISTPSFGNYEAKG